MRNPYHRSFEGDSREDDAAAFEAFVAEAYEHAKTKREPGYYPAGDGIMVVVLGVDESEHAALKAWQPE